MATDAARWRYTVGRALEQARRGRGLSKREAASRAKFSEVVWRQLESGERQVAAGIRVPVNPKDETLEAAARAVGLDPAELFAMAGRPWDGGNVRWGQFAQQAAPDPLAAVHARLDDHERRLKALEATADDEPRLIAAKGDQEAAQDPGVTRRRPSPPAEQHDY